MKSPDIIPRLIYLQLRDGVSFGSCHLVAFIKMFHNVVRKANVTGSKLKDAYGSSDCNSL
jgi:hypothetical protein